MAMEPGSYDVEVTYNFHGGSGRATVTLIVAPGNSRTARDLKEIATDQAKRDMPAAVVRAGGINVVRTRIL
ncbi:hypothetical protein [Streptodolium elevatio]|uniref:Uncharacterized protein n=1 Tax=Streptodolium elevatio TaxID=3157996 RepID=A0ABV3DHG1_9ACTN